MNGRDKIEILTKFSLIVEAVCLSDLSRQSRMTYRW